MTRTIRIGHSPDPDDAFMFYALTAGKVTIPGVKIEHVLEDIETLNRRSRTGELEVTAVSFATYLLIAEQYRMMDPGASMGKGYGPILVAREPIPAAELASRVTAIAGKHTTSALLLRLYVGDPPLIEVAFDKIPHAVLEGQADLGLLIHEGQITYQKMGLTKVLDLGESWQRDTGLPLPLGCNVMRRDLGDATHRALSQALRDSIAWAHANVDEALEYAMRYGRGHRQRDVPPIRSHVRQRLHARARSRGPRRHRSTLLARAPEGSDPGRSSDRPRVGSPFTRHRSGDGAGPRRPRAWWPIRIGLGWAPSDRGRALLVGRETGPRGPAPSPDRCRVADVTAPGGPQ